MKKTLAAAAVAAIAGVAGAANAADMYGLGGLKDGPVYVPPPTWTGFYVGAHVGGYWSDIKNTDNGYYNYYYNQYAWGLPYSWNDTTDGVFGGGQFGYNWQTGWHTGSFVLGVEVDLGAVGLSQSRNIDPYGYYWSKDEATFYADVTGRLGYAAGPALFYVKGGWAYLDAKNSVGGNAYAAPAPTTAPAPVYPPSYNWSSQHSGIDGWTVGGGVEYAFSRHWSIKAEYLFFDFGTNTTTWYDSYFRKTYSIDNEVQVNTFKVGLNYRLTPGYAPLK